MRKVIPIDFETEAIEDRPRYPPIPVGVSIRMPGWRIPKYFAWGHPTKNNCTKAQAHEVLQDAYRSDYGLLFHNAKFDLDVAQEHFKLEIPPWHRIQDTMLLLFLEDPHARELGLKQSAERILGLPPTERDDVRDWLVDNGVVKRGDKKWGAYISKAPGDLVGKYANGDTLRTKQLYDVLAKSVADRGMWEAYEREVRLLPVLLRSERRGIRVDQQLLEADIVSYKAEQVKVEKWLLKRFKSPDLNLDSDRSVAAVLESTGIVTEFVKTPTGQNSVSKKNLTPRMFNDPKVASAIGYRNRLTTCMGTFMEPWLELSVSGSGRIHPTWNQVRQAKGLVDSSGARTGRLSCSRPNFQNIPKSFEDKGDGYVHPAFLNLRPLPLIRMYVLPEKGQVFCHRDYNQQELRILSHFEDMALMEQYNADPRMDVHDFVGNCILEITGLKLPRSAIKILNFGMVYGMGLGKLAEGMDVDIETAKRVKNAQKAALPGLKELDKQIRAQVKQNLPIVTWGGREYFCEPPMMIAGRRQTFEYKLLNYAIQGSAADCTKEAVINYDDACKDGTFLATVHDEINISAPKRAVKSEMKLLREAMESVKFDVPMLSDAKTGDRWGHLLPYKD